MKKKVLFVANTLRHLYLCHRPYLKYFHDNGYEVHIASNSDKLLDNVDKSYKIAIKRNPYSFKNVKAIFELRKIIKHGQYDIIHIHTPMGAVITRLAITKKIKQKSKIIYTAHGFHFYKGCPKINYLLYFPIEKILSKRTDMIITINKEDYDFAKKHFKTNIKYIPGVGFDEERFKTKLTKNKQIELRNKLGLSNKDYVISYIAEISKRKRQDYLLKVISKMNLTNEKFLFIGDSTKSLKVRRLMHKYHLDNVVKIIDFNNNINEYLDISNLIVSVSKQEGLPLNIMEAMYKEKPIIVTDCRGNRDLIKHMENGVVVGLNNQLELISSIECLKNNPELSKKLGQNNRKLINNYSIKKVLPMMEKLYKDIMRDDYETKKEINK